MSRRLDALFAERVLGIKIVPNGKASSGFCDYANPVWEMPNYTESLDAAWAGVEKLGYVVELSGDHKHGWDVGVFGPDYTEAGSSHDAALALALVKACLLAMGVSQDGIDACE